MARKKDELPDEVARMFALGHQELIVDGRLVQAPEGPVAEKKDDGAEAVETKDGE